MTENRSRPRRALVEMVVLKVSPYLRAEQPLMWLCEKDSPQPRLLPIAVGEFEAAAIQMQLSGDRPLRPIPHDLLASLLGELTIPVRRVVIHSVQGQAFVASAVVERGGRLRELDCRPSDGVALALRTEAPVYITRELLDRVSLSSAPDGADPERTMSRFYEVEPQILGDRAQADAAEARAVPVMDKERSRLAELQHRLQQAVVREDYEKAALLRDEIERVRSTRP